MELPEIPQETFAEKLVQLSSLKRIERSSGDYSLRFVQITESPIKNTANQYCARAGWTVDAQ